MIFDTEPNMLEEVARLYWKNGRQKVNLELFTDRVTCGGCDSLITKINFDLQQTGDFININPVTQGIFQASTKDNPNAVAELINIQKKYFYLKIN